MKRVLAIGVPGHRLPGWGDWQTAYRFNYGASVGAMAFQDGGTRHLIWLALRQQA